jgi:hypothetical protein
MTDKPDNLLVSIRIFHQDPDYYGFGPAKVWDDGIVEFYCGNDEWLVFPKGIQDILRDAWIRKKRPDELSAGFSASSGEMW